MNPTEKTPAEQQLDLLRDERGLTFAQATRRMQLQRQRALADEAEEARTEAQQFSRHAERSAVNFHE
jgi:hypothetical protein